VKKTTIGKIFIGVLLSAFLYLQYIVVSRVLLQPKDLTEVNGIITNVERIQIPKRYIGYNYAYALRIKNESKRFAIHEKHKRAFEFINMNNVEGKALKLSYDKKGFNSKDNLTYHIYRLEIDNQEILKINESKQTDKKGIIIFIIADLLIIGMIIYIMKKRNN
jgi:hypothetical protein